MSAFVRDRCTTGEAFAVEKDELWQAWRDWCQNEGAHPGTKAVFMRDLRAAVPGAKPRRPRAGEERVHIVGGLTLDQQSERPLTTP